MCAQEVTHLINTPLQVGALRLPHRLIQAPLAGISCAPFRTLFSLYTSPAYAVTEMISAHSILRHQKLNRRYLARSPEEGRLCIQLSGENPELMYQATHVAMQYKPDIIDLNCGCPKPKIRAKGCGSALLDTPKKLEAIVRAMRRATDLPLTVKIRVAGQTLDEAYLEAATIIEACGADAIIVHGRHYSEDYDVPPAYTQIRRVVERVKIPVIANGDVSDKASLEHCLNVSSASAVMVGRGSIGKPWLFKVLLGESTQPTPKEVHSAFQQHINQLAVLEESEQVALLQARRLLKWYFPDLDSRALAICYKLRDLETLYGTLTAYD